VAESRLKSQVRELLAVPYRDPGRCAGVASVPRVDPIPAQMVSPEQAMVPGRRLSSVDSSESDVERRALQVLMLARKTADEYVALANRHADATRTDARAAAEQTVREAEDAADRVRREADRTLFEAQANAAKLEREAKEQYAAVIAALADERAALQEQIDALHEFDRDYRDQLREFMHSQLQVLDEGDDPALADTPEPADATSADEPDELDEQDEP